MKMNLEENLFAGTSAPSKLDILRTKSCMDSVISPILNWSAWDLDLPETLCF